MLKDKPKFNRKKAKETWEIIFNEPPVCPNCKKPLEDVFFRDKTDEKFTLQPDGKYHYMDSFGTGHIRDAYCPHCSTTLPRRLRDKLREKIIY